MRNLVVGAVLVLGVSSSATQAGPFHLLSVAADGVTPGIPGNAMTWSIAVMPFIDDNVFYGPDVSYYDNASTPTEVHGKFKPPSVSQVNGLANPWRYSVYVGLDPVGPTTPDVTGMPGTGYQSNQALVLPPGEMVLKPGSLRASWSGLSILSGSGDSMFLMNITLPGSGHVFSTLGVQIAISEIATPGVALTGLVQFGSANAVTIGSQNYYLDFSANQVTLAALRGASPTHTNYVIQLRGVPVPGAATAAPLLLLGLIGSQRRRAR